MNRISLLSALTFISAPLMLTSVQAASLDGTWSGRGFVQPSGGKREKVRCRATYSRTSSKTYDVRATCASASNSIRQTGTLLWIRKGRYAGDFYNRQFDIGGRLRVTVRGARQSVTFKGDGVTGKLNLRKR